jgi:hypothetical protein
MEIVDISEIKENELNPRYITEDKFEKLKRSIKEFPEMLEKRPLVVDENMIVLGGNMRLKAIKELKIKKVPIIRAIGWSEEQKKEFTIKDNLAFGAWDWDSLANEWDEEKLEHWGLELPLDEKIDKMEEGEVIHLEKSLQVIPKKEYILIMADEDSDEWEELKTIFKCTVVRQGGSRVNASSDQKGLERVFDLKTFKKRVLNEQ